MGLLAIGYSSNAQNKEITIDGKGNDWPIPLKNYDSQTQISYSITNDNANLYFCFRTEDLKVQSRLIKMGFQISIDTKGRKSTKNSFLYKPELNISPRERHAGKPLEIGLKTEFKLSPMIVTLKGFANYSKETTLDIRTLKNEAFALDWDSSNVLIIEYKVPFSELAFTPDTTSILSLGFILPAIEVPSGIMPPPSRGMGGGPPDGEGMGEMRPTPDMQNGGGRPEMGEMTKEKKFWVKFKINGI